MIILSLFDCYLCVQCRQTLLHPGKERRSTVFTEGNVELKNS